MSDPWYPGPWRVGPEAEKTIAHANALLRLGDPIIPPPGSLVSVEYPDGMGSPRVGRVMIPEGDHYTLIVRFPGGYRRAPSLRHLKIVELPRKYPPVESWPRQWDRK